MIEVKMHTTWKKTMYNLDKLTTVLGHFRVLMLAVIIDQVV